MKWLLDIPWLKLKGWFLDVRSRVAGLPRKRGGYVRVEATEDELLHMFGGRSWAPNYEFSYDRQEDLNLARVEYRGETMYSQYDVQWWQYHLRGYKVEDGVWELTCHFEPEPTENPIPHLKGRGYDRQRGLDTVRSILTGNGFEFEEVEHE